jgi:hypothetical protein
LGGDEGATCRSKMSAKKEIGREELSGYLHLPEKAVAKKLGICLTSLKKVCRLHGITRWPYRKLKSLDKRIHKIEASLAAGEGGADEQANLRQRLDVRDVPSRSCPAFASCASLTNWLEGWLAGWRFRCCDVHGSSCHRHLRLSCASLPGVLRSPTSNTADRLIPSPPTTRPSRRYTQSERPSHSGRQGRPITQQRMTVTVERRQGVGREGSRT